MKAANLPTFIKYGNGKDHIFVLPLQKMKFNRPKYVINYGTCMQKPIIIIIIYSFNVKLISATFNNAIGILGL